MSFTSVLLYPFLLLFPAAGAGDRADDAEAGVASLPAPAPLPPGSNVWPAAEGVALIVDPPVLAGLLPETAPQDARQVRIEQRMTIRIAPRTAMPLPDMFVSLPRDGVPQIMERKIGKCLSISGIASVRPDRANRLLLFMRDRSVVGADLDRSCRARDFYSGFYLQRSEDGRLCVDRDTLLSRSGMNCKLTRIRELVEEER